MIIIGEGGISLSTRGWRRASRIVLFISHYSHRQDHIDYGSILLFSWYDVTGIAAATDAGGVCVG